MMRTFEWVKQVGHRVVGREDHHRRRIELAWVGLGNANEND